MSIIKRRRGTRATPAGSSAAETVVPDADVNLTLAAEEWFTERGINPNQLSRDQKLAVQAPWQPGDPVRGATYTIGLLPNGPKDAAEPRTEKELELGL